MTTHDLDTILYHIEFCSRFNTQKNAMWCVSVPFQCIEKSVGIQLGMWLSNKLVDDELYVQYVTLLLNLQNAILCIIIATGNPCFVQIVYKFHVPVDCIPTYSTSSEWQAQSLESFASFGTKMNLECFDPALLR